MASRLSALQEGDVVTFLALMKDGTAVPVQQGILIAIDHQEEEIYCANLNMNPKNSKEIMAELSKDIHI